VVNAIEEAKTLNKAYLDELKSYMNEDTQKKASAIMDILEIGTPSIAHAKWILHACEEMLDRCSGCFKTKTDAEKS